MNTKQVIVVRTKFPDGKGGFMSMRKGKLAAQVAHASMKVFFDRASFSLKTLKYTSLNGYDGVKYYDSMEIPLTECMMEWAKGTFTKICLQAETEQEIRDIYQKSVESGIPCSLIEDSGATEFNGVKTITCCAIGPAPSEKIDEITGNLKLL